MKGESKDTDSEMAYGDLTLTTLKHERDAFSMTELFKVSHYELITEQDVDPSLKPFLELVKSKETPEMESPRHFRNENLLYRQWVTNRHSFLNPALQIVVPTKFGRAGS